MARLARRGGLWLALFLLAVAVTMLVWTFTTSASGTGHGSIGPWGWPRAVLALLAVFTLTDLVAEARAGLRQPGASLQGVPTAGPGQAEQPDEARVQTQAGSRVKLATAVCLVVGYAVAVLFLGFLIGTFVFSLLFIYLGGYRRLVWTPVIAALGALAVTYLFVRVVYIPLPLGAGPFKTIEVSLYHALGLF